MEHFKLNNLQIEKENIKHSVNNKRRECNERRKIKQKLNS